MVHMVRALCTRLHNILIVTPRIARVFACACVRIQLTCLTPLLDHRHLSGEVFGLTRASNPSKRQFGTQLVERGSAQNPKTYF